jgi:glutamine synthetase
VKVFENSDFAKETFGQEVVNHYAHFYNSEQAAYNTAVTDWERKRYFEQI